MANVPSLGTAAVSPNLIQVGPAMLWTNVTKPADGALLLVSGNVSGVYDQRVFGPMLYTISGVMVGSTIGSSTMSYKPTFVDIQTEQNLAIVEKVLNSETASVQCAIAELTAETMQQAAPGSYWNQPIATVTSAADPLQAGQTVHKMTIGGLRLVAPQCIAFISANRRIGLSGTGPFSYVLCGYNAVSVDGFTLPFERGRETVYSTKFDFIADTARSVGDQLLQLAVRQVG